MAFLTLFRIATGMIAKVDKFIFEIAGDNWNGIMKDTLREECDDSEDCLSNCCINQYIAPLFFVIFVLLAQFVLVNVVVAVLMKHLEETHKQVKFEDLFLVQCFQLCSLECKEMLLNMVGRDINRKSRKTKADLTHKIETYFD